MAVPRSFTFRLQRLKNAREIREQQEQSRLVAFENELRTEQGKLQTMLDREAEVIAEMIAPDGGIFDPEGRLARENWLRVFRQTIEVQRGSVQQAQGKVAQQALVLQEARKQVKVLEKLEEKQREEWREELLREQSVFLDDLSGQGYIRQTREAARRTAEQTEVQS